MTVKRKTFVIGSSLALTLPMSWCKQNGITSGTEISIDEVENVLLISNKSTPSEIIDEEPECNDEEYDVEAEPATPQSSIDIDAIIRRRLALEGGDY